MKFSRILEMKEYITIHRSVTNEELCDKFAVSMQTLRRDLKILQDEGFLNKVYGGVMYNDQSQTSKVPTILERENIFLEEKRLIGKKAADLVNDGDVIFIDSGTTAIQIIPFLAEKANITIISHSLDVFNKAKELEKIKLIALGGVYNAYTNSFLMDTSQYKFYFHKAFVATVGVSLTHQLTNTDINEGYIKKCVIQAANKAYILCDSSKFEKTTINCFADLSDITAIISDDNLSNNIKKMYEKSNVKIL